MQGSEHTINGRQDPVEIHFVHYDSKFATPTDAVNSGEADALSVCCSYPTRGRYPLNLF
jgi:hypothetical protein